MKPVGLHLSFKVFICHIFSQFILCKFRPVSEFDFDAVLYPILLYKLSAYIALFKLFQILSTHRNVPKILPYYHVYVFFNPYSQICQIMSSHERNIGLNPKFHIFLNGKSLELLSHF